MQRLQLNLSMSRKFLGKLHHNCTIIEARKQYFEEAYENLLKIKSDNIQNQLNDCDLKFINSDESKMRYNIYIHQVPVELAKPKRLQDIVNKLKQVYLQPWSEMRKIQILVHRYFLHGSSLIIVIRICVVSDILDIPKNSATPVVQTGNLLVADKTNI